MVSIVTSTQGENALGRAVQALNAGKPVAIPTETVYGLAADATNGDAVAGVYQMKGRPAFNPLICHVDGMVMASEYGQFDELAMRLIDRFWPGPLTLVLPKAPKSNVSELVTAGLDTIALRCPEGFARQVISALGRPLAAPSANKSGRLSPTTAQHVAEEFVGDELLIIDGGPCSVGLESTIVKLENSEAVILRPGVITQVEVEEAIGRPLAVRNGKAEIEAPGMMTSHYAPNATVLLNCKTCLEGAAWLGFGNRPVVGPVSHSLNLSKDSSLVEAAANLYAYLKALDATGAPNICVAPIPHEELGVAINDRLRRAAAPRGEERQRETG